MKQVANRTRRFTPEVASPFRRLSCAALIWKYKTDALLDYVNLFASHNRSLLLRRNSRFLVSNGASPGRMEFWRGTGRDGILARDRMTFWRGKRDRFEVSKSLLASGGIGNQLPGNHVPQFIVDRFIGALLQIGTDAA